MVYYSSFFIALVGCTVGPHYPTETAYPGSGFGKVLVVSFIESAPAFYGQDGKPFVIQIPIEGQTFQMDTALLHRTPNRVDYHIQGSDGTLHIMSSTVAFPKGACIAWTGYADGPSRTHWSFGRVRMEKSDKCTN